MSQPVYEVAYPNYDVIRKPNSPHSNGNYVPVFVVLAVIVVISAAACALGRLCNRRHHRDKEAHHHNKAVSHRAEVHPKVEHDDVKPRSPRLGPGEWESTQRPVFKLRERGDVELGFDKQRMANNGGGTVAPPPHNNGGGMVAPPPRYNSGGRPQVRFADNV